MNEPIAIVIPSYNSAAYLPAVIDSALRQTRPAAQVIVVDDGSTDATPEICARYGGAIVALRQPNAGVSAARNFGARTATAPWLLFLDADDTLLPHALEALGDTARATAACGVAYGRVLARGRSAIEDKLHGLPSAAGAPPQPARANFKRSVITTPGAALVRRDLWEKTGGFIPGYEPMEDRDFWMKCGMLAAFAPPARRSAAASAAVSARSSPFSTGAAGADSTPPSSARPPPAS